MTTRKFEFTDPIEVTLTNVNTRKEIHGEQHVQAVDLSMKGDFPNSFLGMLHPTLCASLYYNAAADAGQAGLEGLDESLPNLRYPKLNGQKFSWGGKDKIRGYRLIIDYGLGGPSDIDLDLCDVSGIAFETKEGGTTPMTWKVQNAGEHLDVDLCGKLALMGGEKITIRLIAPTVYQATSGDDDDGDDGDDDNTNPLGLDLDPEEQPENPLPLNADGSANPQTPEEALAASHAAK